MIIKLLTRKAAKSGNPNASIRGLIKYVLNYAANAKDKDAKVLVLHNLFNGKNMDGYIKAFSENEKLRQSPHKHATILSHAIISFSPADHGKVTTGILQKVSRKWIELTAEDCLCLAVSHEKENRHVHLVVSGVKTNGKSARLTKKQFAEALLEMERFQAKEFPQLALSAINHEKTRGKEKILSARESTKVALAKEMKAHLHNAKAYDAFLHDMPYAPYFRAGRLQGIAHNRKKYRLTLLGISHAMIERLIDKQQQLQQLANARAATKEPPQRRRVQGKFPALHREKDLTR